MVKEAKNIDFVTSGRQPSTQDFARISEWIQKKKKGISRSKKQSSRQKHIVKHRFGAMGA